MRFLQSRARYKGFVGGIGSGKSYAGAANALLEADTGTLGVVLAPTYPMLRDATLRTFLELADPLVAGINRSEMLVKLKNGAEVLFRSADNPSRLRGPNLSWAWLDEAGYMEEGIWPIIIGRLRQGGKAGRAWVTTTPKGFNWVYDVFGPDAPGVATGEVQTFTSRTADNPYLASEFVQTLRSNYTGAYARQELEGAFTSLDGGLFKREWLTNILHAIPECKEWVRFWDLAASGKGDYVVGAKVGAGADGTVVIGDIVRGRWEWPEARNVIIATALADGPSVRIGVETVAFQLSAFQELIREPQLLAYTVEKSKPDKGKYERAMPWAARAEAGLVRLISGSWIPAFTAEVCDFPGGHYDDQVDAVSGAVDMLANNRSEWVIVI